MRRVQNLGDGELSRQISQMVDICLDDENLRGILIRWTETLRTKVNDYFDDIEREEREREKREEIRREERKRILQEKRFSISPWVERTNPKKRRILP